MSERAWSELTDAHRRSVADFVALAEAVPETEWERPLGEGQWSPAQVAEHLRLVYQVVGRELAGSRGLRVRTPGWLRVLIRLRYLSGILEKGRIPGKQRAPREIAPGPGPFARRPTLEAFGEGAARLELALAERRARAEPGVSHHLFGRFSPPDSLRFLTVHNQHHIRQLSARWP